MPQQESPVLTLRSNLHPWAVRSGQVMPCSDITQRVRQRCLLWAVPKPDPSLPSSLLFGADFNYGRPMATIRKRGEEAWEVRVFSGRSRRCGDSRAEQPE